MIKLKNIEAYSMEGGGRYQMDKIKEKFFIKIVLHNDKPIIHNSLSLYEALEIRKKYASLFVGENLIED